MTLSDAIEIGRRKLKGELPTNADMNAAIRKLISTIERRRK